MSLCEPDRRLRGRPCLYDSWGNELDPPRPSRPNPFGLKAKFAGYYLSDEETISAIGESELLVGSIGARNLHATSPQKKTRNSSTILQRHGELSFLASRKS